MGFQLRKTQCHCVVGLVFFLLAVVAAAAAAAPPTKAALSANLHNISSSSTLQWPEVEEEWPLESETSRRLLQGMKNYLGYDATRTRGAPVITPPKSGFPYSRNCLKIHNCRNGY